MRRPRPAARYSEIAFAFVAALFIAWGICAWWPQPDLDVHPLYCRTTNTVVPAPLLTWPTATPNPPDGLPSAYERYTR